MQKKFHESFALNGVSFQSETELLTFSKEISSEVHSFLVTWFDSSEVITVQTSGSTGKPKQIELGKAFMKNSAKATGSFFKSEEGTKALMCLSANYIAGKMMLVRALTLGWKLDVVTPDSNPLEKNVKQYDFSAMVPLQLQNSLQQLYQIKTLIVGGGVVSDSLKNELNKISTKVYATYGMTETVTHIAVKQLNHINCYPNFYKVLPNVQIYKDNRNCLLIDAPNVAEELVITNDVIELISDNQFKWLGRYDNVVNSGGIKLQPEIIEQKLSKLISKRFFTVGIPDKILGEKLILIVENMPTETIRALKNKLLENDILGKYEVPKEILNVDKFVTTTTKKIQRRKTLDLLKLI